MNDTRHRDAPHPLPEHETHLAMPCAPGDWPALTHAVLDAWHHELHRRAGSRRIDRATLALGPAWTDAAGPGAQGPMRALAARLYRDGAHIEVRRIADAPHPRLHLRWAPWHAPPAPQRTRAGQSPHLAHPGATGSSRSPSHPTGSPAP